MKFKAVLIGVIALSAALFVDAANASLMIACQQISTTHNYMQVSDSYVSSTCVDSGMGELTGTDTTDAFLQANSGWVGINGATGTQLSKISTQTTGLFSVDSNLWNSWDNLLIGFRFGTGNQPDEWFVYTLDNLVDVGEWTFINVGGKGGGFTNAQLYGSGAKPAFAQAPVNVPEPETLSMLGAGLLVLGLTLRRSRSQSH